MKIGIITIHCAYNYGAVFQAFALKEYIKSIVGQNDTVNVIDYRPDHFESKKGIHFTKDIVSDIIELERLAMHSKLGRRDNAFEEFINENDSLSETCRTREELSALAKEYDVLISGSDQVWNYNITGGDTSYLLDIAGFTGKKLSFSSSMGSFRFYSDHEEKVKSIFDSYSACACREADGCEYLEKLTGKKWQLTCDPTVLLNADVYSSLIENKVRSKIKKLAEEKFLLIYNLSTSKEIFDVAEKVAKSRGLKVYQIFPSLRKNSAVDRLLNDISPEEFLYLYTKTDFVVTNSFHGTCFAIINRKDFYTVKPTGSNNRLQTLLAEAGIPERLLLEEKEINNADADKSIDYKRAVELLEGTVDESKKYLINSICTE